jgi:NAD-dependent dihydropyrimidine dehydrogenase PreA subunit
MPGTVRRFEPTGEARWFPVIDPDRCTHCLSCLEFCLFGVYDADDQQQLVVREPDACKPGCPACSRVCPSQAIIFPLFQEDPGIAGVEGAEIQPFDPGQLSALKAAYARGELDEDKAKDVLQQKNVCACRLGAPPTHEFDAAIDEALG